MAKSRNDNSSKPFQGFGWVKDAPSADDRWFDVTNHFSTICNEFKVDLCRFFPPIRNQGERNTSTSFACLSVIEYFETRVTGALCERSKEFLHSMTQATHNVGKHLGTSISSTLQTLARFGAPPEVYCPYAKAGTEKIKLENHLFNFVGDFRGLKFAKLDLPDGDGKSSLEQVQASLGLAIPVVFGFEGHHLMSPENPFPISRPFYSPGWQTVVACGFDDEKRCLLVRNSWGTRWASRGYGWLPYSYVLNDHAADFWILWKDAWLGAMT